MIYNDFVKRLESGGREDAVNPRSGAWGPYQFMPATFNDLARRNPAILASDNPQEVAMADFTRQNAAVLRQALGREPSMADLYLAHRFGAGGGRALLQAPRETPLQDVLRGVFTGRGTPSFDAVMRQNPDLARFQTVGQMIDFYNQRAGLPGEAPAAAPQAPAQNDFVSRVMAGSLSGDPRVQQARDTLLGSLTAADNPSLADLGQAAMSMAGSVGPVNLQQTLAGVQNQRAQRAAQVLQLVGQDEARMINLLRIDAERGGKTANTMLTFLQRMGNIEPAQRAQLLARTAQMVASGQVRSEPDLIAAMGNIASELGIRESPRTGLTPVQGYDAQGNPVVMLPRADGQLVQAATPQGVTYAPTTRNVDVGTGTVQVGPGGRVIGGVIPRDVRGQTREREIGEVQGQRAGQSGQAITNADIGIGYIDSVLQHPMLDRATGVLAMTRRIPGSPMADFGARLEQVQGQAFLRAFETLKGGGQITEREGQIATAAISRIQNPNLSPSALRAALNDLRTVFASARQRAIDAARAANVDVPASATPATTPTPSAPATPANPFEGFSIVPINP